MNDRVQIAGVCERDIDLLLLEEFHASPGFRSWFLERALQGAASSATYVGAKRSVTHSSGESDLEVSFVDAEGRRMRLMVENKVGAGLQPDQAARYRVRGASYVSSGSCEVFATVIVAPGRYFGETQGSKGFDARIAYEDLLDWYIKADELGERRNYKVSLLRSAIAKGTLGYQPDLDDITSDFWHDYWKLARKHAPELEMPEPRSKPAGAGFIWFRPPSLPKGMSICHKVNRGYVDLQFPAMGERLNELHARYEAQLEPDMQIVKATKSGAIRLIVPALDSSKKLEGQVQSVLVALEEARRILDWFHLARVRAGETPPRA
ncbi:hypothetical protein [Cognatilysobacter tabacisoli]|uniref:hypothetical protein n=1 Tax=Cognatilysobacter tabacisoli TaxID=2315424 RepID=UPI001300798B|nr:hypothetical protein [Lysobacter tabacisoli]